MPAKYVCVSDLCGPKSERKLCESLNHRRSCLLPFHRPHEWDLCCGSGEEWVVSHESKNGLWSSNQCHLYHASFGSLGSHEFPNFETRFQRVHFVPLLRSKEGTVLHDHHKLMSEPFQFICDFCSAHTLCARTLAPCEPYFFQSLNASNRAGKHRFLPLNCVLCLRK